jgi:hypothetical protein
MGCEDLYCDCCRDCWYEENVRDCNGCGLSLCIDCDPTLFKFGKDDAVYCKVCWGSITSQGGNDLFEKYQAIYNSNMAYNERWEWERKNIEPYTIDNEAVELNKQLCEIHVKIRILYNHQLAE